jgi:hypothetical protein
MTKNRQVRSATEVATEGFRFDILTMLPAKHGVGFMPTVIYYTEQERHFELESRPQHWAAIGSQMPFA